MVALNCLRASLRIARLEKHRLMAIIPANMTPHGLVELYHSDQECILEVPTRDTLDVNSVEDEVLKIHV
eukprot:13873.XXX_297551_297754_1 [CDS] Oithona nana genome sequencing.